MHTSRPPRVYKDSRQLRGNQVLLLLLLLSLHFSLHRSVGMGWSLCFAFNPFDISWWEGGVEKVQEEDGEERGRWVHVFARIEDGGKKKNCRGETGRKQGGWEVDGGENTKMLLLFHLCCPGSERRATVDYSHMC